MLGSLPDRKSEIAASEISDALDRILQSPPFFRSKKLRGMLRFLVEETLAGRGEAIKEYVLAVEVFGRPSSFDPRLDSIVRVEAGRLRSALEKYYDDEGRADPLVICMEKGSYVPVFRRRTGGARSLPHKFRLRSGNARKLVSWLGALSLILGAAWFTMTRLRSSLSTQPVTIAVLPFDNLSDEPETGYFCFGLTDEITTELAKAGSVRVVARTSAANTQRGTGYLVG